MNDPKKNFEAEDEPAGKMPKQIKMNTAQSDTRKDLPVFPNIIPASQTKTMFSNIEADSFNGEEDLQNLFSMMFNLPEAKFYYFEQLGGPKNTWIHRARDAGQLLMNEVEFYFYKHPKFESDYVRIPKRETYQFDWEREVVEHEPMFGRLTLRLTESKKRELDVKARIQIEQDLNKDLIETKHRGVARQPAGLLTGWTKVDRTIGEVHKALEQAQNEEQYQTVGLLCREALISLAQAVYDSARHPSLDGVPPSATDAKRMLEAFIAVGLKGSEHEGQRKHARAAVDRAVELQHQRTASFRPAALCVEATCSVVNVIALLAGKRDP
jgi:hypothetical protein